jgi:hypothetical protein
MRSISFRFAMSSLIFCLCEVFFKNVSVKSARLDIKSRSSIHAVQCRDQNRAIAQQVQTSAKQEKKKKKKKKKKLQTCASRLARSFAAGESSDMVAFSLPTLPLINLQLSKFLIATVGSRHGRRESVSGRLSAESDSSVRQRQSLAR